MLPSDPATIRIVRIGGLDKPALLAAIRANAVQLNASAEALFAHEEFRTAEAVSHVETVQSSVADLGCPAGGTMAEILQHAAALGLTSCPLELGPHLRWQFLDQPEAVLNEPLRKHGAPPGSLTVVSPPVSEDDDVPKGFSLRRVDGALWLRGDQSGAEHVWSPEDRLVSCRRVLPRPAEEII